VKNSSGNINQRLEPADFPGFKVPPLAGLQVAQPKPGELDSPQFQDRMSDRPAHLADFSLAALLKLEPQPARFLAGG
jgi:hypothetical protein